MSDKAAAAIIDPPQPEGLGEYSIDRLVPSTIKVYMGQADYKAKTGQDAPPFVSFMPIKLWDDTSAPEGFAMITYHTAHLDPSGQKPVVTDISMPSSFAAVVNIPTDNPEGKQPVGNQYLTPIRALLPNETLVASPFGLSVINNDIDKPAPVPSGGGGTGDGFNPNDRAMLTAMANKILVE